MRRPIDFNISFVKAARPGQFVGKGRVVNLGKTIALTEAELFDEAGELVARGHIHQPRHARRLGQGAV